MADSNDSESEGPVTKEKFLKKLKRLIKSDEGMIILVWIVVSGKLLQRKVMLM